VRQEIGVRPPQPMPREADHRLAVARTGSAAVMSGFGRPFGLAVGPDAWFYVCDMSLHAVFRLSPELDRFSRLGEAGGWSAPRETASGTLGTPPDAKPGMLNGPHSIDFAPDGSFCVTCYYEPALHFFGAAGNHRSTLRRLSPELLLEGPATGLYDPAGQLLVTEYRLGLVITLGADGRPLGVVGDRNVAGAVRLERPHMAVRLAEDDILIADTWNHRLVVADSAGIQQRWWGLPQSGDARPGWYTHFEAARPDSMPGALNAPVSVDLDAGGKTVLVSDWGNNRLQIIPLAGDEAPRVIDLGLKSPYDARRLDGRLLVADTHNHRVLISGAPR
jgi:hypothetical protein